MYGFKLMRKRKNGTIGPLFINTKKVVPIDEWIAAEDVPTKGYKHRPGWHILLEPNAPHLSMKGRVWVLVEFKEFVEEFRPKSQGGSWFVAQQMRVIKELDEWDVFLFDKMAEMLSRLDGRDIEDYV